MRNLHLKRGVFGSFLLLLTVLAAAQGHAAPANCRTWTDPGVMSFLVDPSVSPGPITATVTTQPTVSCTSGTLFIVTSASANAGSGFAPPPITGILSDGAGHQILYTFDHLASGVGTGINQANEISLGISGSILKINYENAFVGIYSDTVSILVTP